MWNRKLGRTADHRKAMFRNMVTSLIEAGQIETTEMKAKELSSIMDELVTLAKRGDLHARRQAAAYSAMSSLTKTADRLRCRSCSARSDRLTQSVRADILVSSRRVSVAEMPLRWQSLNL